MPKGPLNPFCWVPPKPPNASWPIVGTGGTGGGGGLFGRPNGFLDPVICEVRGFASVLPGIGVDAGRANGGVTFAWLLLVANGEFDCPFDWPN